MRSNTLTTLADVLAARGNPILQQELELVTGLYFSIPQGADFRIVLNPIANPLTFRRLDLWILLFDIVIPRSRVVTKSREGEAYYIQSLEFYLEDSLSSVSTRHGGLCVTINCTEHLLQPEQQHETNTN